MTAARPALHRIEAAVQRLAAPGRFERLVKEVIQVEWPSRFDHLHVRGTNVNDRTHTGWPDLSGQNGDLAEVTFGMENWRKHLADDLKKIRKAPAGAVSSFTLVSWSELPSEHQLAKARKSMEAAGVPAGESTFIFRDDLVTLLQKPRFASVWRDLLELPVSADPFGPIADAYGIWGAPKSTTAFRPTRDDFVNGRVHLPQIAEQVVSSLQGGHAVTVLGRGASGKTVLAMAVSMYPQWRGAPVYYLDLEHLAEGNVINALEAITTFGDSGVLFIVDNIHLVERATDAMVRQWRALGDGSSLLLLGRATSRLMSNESDDALAAEDIRRFILEVTRADLAGVYLRYAQRFGRTPEPPPAEVLAAWAKRFTGDLLVFSTAVRNRMPALGTQDDWTLEPKDAADEIQKIIAQTSAEQRRDLPLLALLSKYELPSPARLFPPLAWENLLASGVVFSSRVGGARTYSLVHSGMGDLVLSVLHVPECDVIDELLRRDQATATRLGMRFIMRMRHATRGEMLKHAKHIFQTVLSAGDLSWIEQEPALVREVAHRTGDSVLDWPLLDATLSRPQSAFIRNVLAEHVDYLLQSLDQIEKYLPSVFLLLKCKLVEPETVDRLLGAIFNDNGRSLARFLRVAREQIPELFPVVGRLMKARADDVARVMATVSVGKTAIFQSVAAADVELFRTVLPALRRDPLLSLLVKSAVTLSLGDLFHFLNFLWQTDRDLLRRVAIRLFQQHRDDLLERFIKLHLGVWIGALADLRATLPSMHDRMVELLLEPGRMTRVMERLASVGMSDLALFLRSDYAPLARVHAGVIQHFSSPEGTRALSERLASSAAHEIQTVIETLRTTAPNLRRAVVLELRTTRLAALVTNVVEEPLDHAGALFRYLYENETELFNAFVESLCASHPLRYRFTQRICASSMVQVGSLLRNSTAFSEELRELIIGAIVSAQMQEPSEEILLGRTSVSLIARALAEKPHAVTEADHYTRIARRAGSTLSGALAMARTLESHSVALATEISAIALYGHVDRLNRLSLDGALHAIRMVGVDHAAAQAFLGAISPRWLSLSTTQTLRGRLSDVGFLLWSLFPPTQRRRFITADLKTAFNKALRETADDTAITLSLIGVANLLDLDVRLAPGAWMNAGAIAESLASGIAGCVANGHLSFLASRRWLGARVIARGLARMNKTPLRVSEETGTLTLALWREADMTSERIADLNATMIAWLERCAAAGWTLCADETRFLP